MTREEAIKIIDCYDIGFYDLSGEKIPADKLVEAFDMAIEALSKPTCKKCEDLISRKQAIDELNEFIKPFVGLIGDMGAAINGAREVIKDVPSIEAIPCEVADKVGEENERLIDKIGELEEQIQAMEARIIIARMAN